MKSAEKRIENLVRLLHARLPDAAVEVDRPARPKGSWFVDVRAHERSAVIELRPTLGFGVSSTPTDGFGEGPDEFIEDETVTAERVAGLLRSGERTEPQRPKLLRELREQRGVSQVRLAALLGVKQPSISKMERRDDMSLRMLQQVVEVLGGVLEIRARFPDESLDVELGHPPPRRG